MSRYKNVMHSPDHMPNVLRDTVLGMRSERGQRFLRDLRDALDAMPQKRLVALKYKTSDGEYCAVGCVAEARGVDLSTVVDHTGDDAVDCFSVTLPFHLNVNGNVVAWIEAENDRTASTESPEDRWRRMRAWVEKYISPTLEARDGSLT